MKSRYPKLKDYEGFEIDPKTTMIRLACCDCGLVHDINITVIAEGEKVDVAFKRFNRGTAQLRRHQYGKLQQQSVNGWRMRRDK